MIARQRYWGLLLLVLISATPQVWSQRKLVDSLQQFSVETFSKKKAIMHLAQLAQAYWMVNPDSSILYAGEAKARALEIDYPAGLAKAQNSLGSAFYLKGEYENAIQELESAFQLRLALGDYSGGASCLTNLGRVYLEQGLYSQALECFLRSLKLEEKHGTPEGLAGAQLNIADVHFHQQSWAASSEYTHKAIDELQKLPGEPRQLAYAYNNLGNIAFQGDKDYEKSLAYHLKALALRRKLNSPTQTSGSLINVGAAYLALEAPDKALEFLQEAQNMAHQYGLRPALPDILLNQGKAWEQKDDPEKALGLYRAAFEEAMRTGAAPKIFDAADRISAALYQSERYREAFDYQTIATTYQSRLLNQEKVQQLTKLEMEYQFDKERSSRREANLIALNRQKNLRNTALIFFAFTLLGLFLLYRHHRRIDRHNQVLYQKNREIEQQKETLNRLNKTKDKLFSVIAHDLRSPLAGLKSIMLLADSEELTPEELKVLLPEINKNLDETSGLLENLLYWARSQMGGERLEKKPVDLKVLIDDTVNLLMPQAKNKGIQLENQVQAPLMAMADENMIYLILRNLISNALKFTKAGGTVRIMAETGKEYLRLAVRDTGIGISPEDQQKLFSNEFFSTTGTDREKGTGLGLVLSKDFVEKHGGTLKVESALKQGSTFQFTLPRVS